MANTPDHRCMWANNQWRYGTQQDCNYQMCQGYREHKAKAAELGYKHWFEDEQGRKLDATYEAESRYTQCIDKAIGDINQGLMSAILTEVPVSQNIDHLTMRLKQAELAGLGGKYGDIVDNLKVELANALIDEQDARLDRVARTKKAHRLSAKIQKLQRKLDRLSREGINF